MIVSAALAEAMNAEPHDEGFFATNFVKGECLQHSSRDGSTRTVFRARGRPSTPYEGKEYIIKHIYEVNESRKRFLRRQNEFLSELSTKGTLPNIVSVFHHSISESPKNARGQSELRLSILMEYCNWHGFLPSTYERPELRDIGRSNELFARLIFRQISLSSSFFLLSRSSCPSPLLSPSRLSLCFLFYLFSSCFPLTDPLLLITIMTVVLFLLRLLQSRDTVSSLKTRSCTVI